VGRARVRSFACLGLNGGAGRAHSVRPESCDSPSSPEPAASWFGGDHRLFGERAARTPCVLRAVILTAVQSLRLAGSEGAC
jgi:hypothetical protein